MIGLDTNVLARYLTQDDRAQAAKAGKIIQKCNRENPGYINLIVLAELFWLLDQGYKYNRARQVDLLQSLLQLEDLVVEASDEVYSALQLFEKSAAQLADCLIVIRNQQARCSTTYSFDKKAARLAGITLVS